MTNEQIAKVCHEANRAYCATLGDTSQVPWEQAPEWQRTSAVNGVEHARDPAAKPSDSHDGWLKEKAATGWKYGPVKDPEKKEHPCFVPFADLPEEQKRKDALFLAVARALM
ncbi:MAG TPA: RyR domain-containing protein [Spirochaetia bacterium]|nr:RyR domain-containing protein [Spirochaetia bacterium]